MIAIFLESVIAKRLLIVSATIPVFIYTVFFLFKDIWMFFLKNGWAERPFIFLACESIFVYSLYVYTLIIVSFWQNKHHPDALVTICFVTNMLLLFVYWLCFLFSVIGITIVKYQ